MWYKNFRKECLFDWSKLRYICSPEDCIVHTHFNRPKRYFQDKGTIKMKCLTQTETMYKLHKLKDKAIEIIKMTN